MTARRSRLNFRQRALLERVAEYLYTGSWECNNLADDLVKEFNLDARDVPDKKEELS